MTLTLDRAATAVDDMLVFARSRLIKAATDPAKRKQQALFDDVTGAFTDAMADYFRAFARRALPVAKAALRGFDPDDIDWDFEEDELEELLTGWYARVGQATYDIVGNQIGAEIDFDLNGRGVKRVMSRVGTRVKGITDTSRQALRRVVAESIERGLSIEQLVDGVEGTGFTGLADLVAGWASTVGDAASRAQTIALTETATAYSLSSTAAYRDSGLIDNVEVLDGPECVDPDSGFVPYGGLVGLKRAWFSGQCRRIEFMSPAGLNNITVGPNHPVLSAIGWVPAKLLREGHEIVHDAFIDDATVLSELDLDQAPTIKDVFIALRGAAPSRRRWIRGDELHGDAQFCKGEVEAVGPAGSLLIEADSPTLQQLGEFALVVADPNLEDVASGRGSLEFALGLTAASTSGVSSCKSLESSILPEDRIVPSRRLSRRAAPDAQPDQNSVDGPRGATQSDPNRWAAEAGFVESADELAIDARPGSIGTLARAEVASGVVERAEAAAALRTAGIAAQASIGLRHRFRPVPITRVEVLSYDGYVYDASTRAAAFSINGIVVRNCGWTEHDDPDHADGSIRTLDEADEYPTAHPHCQRAFAPVAAR